MSKKEAQPGKQTHQNAAALLDAFLLGIDIGGTKISLAALDQNGAVIRQQKIETREIFSAHADPTPPLAAAIRQFCARSQIELDRLKGIVIGVPGKIDPKSQQISSCPNLKLLEGCNISQALSAELGIPVIAENDVNLIALGEQHQGAGKGNGNFAVIYVGTGIGGGLILDGKLYAGADGAAGELGHVPIVPNGRLCTCGTRGCLEMYCSGKALAEMALEKLGLKNHNSEDKTDETDWSLASEVFNAARAGETWANEMIVQAFEYLGWGLTQLATIVNPDLILLGGGIMNAWPEGIEIVRNKFINTASVPYKHTVQIEMAALLDNASFAGAHAVIMNLLAEESPTG